MKLLKSRKAVSPVIAVVLLIALTVAAAALVYAIVANQKVNAQIQIDSGSITSTSTATLTIKNTGGTDAVLSYVVIRDTNGTDIATATDTTQASIDTTTLAQGDKITITIKLQAAAAGNFISGHTYSFVLYYADAGTTNNVATDAFTVTYT